jgi:hypothetical protein
MDTIFFIQNNFSALNSLYLGGKGGQFHVLHTDFSQIHKSLVQENKQALHSMLWKDLKHLVLP